MASKSLNKAGQTLVGPLSAKTTGTSAGRFVGATTAGPPTTGSFLVGDFVASGDGNIYVCITAGTPGTWTGPDNIGTIIMSGSATAPNGHLACDGSAVSRTLYAGLFGKIGTTYGVGDGSTTFNLPNLTGGTFPMGDSIPGESGGSSAHTHTSAAHVHALGTLGWALVSFESGAHQARIPVTTWTKNIQITATALAAAADSGTLTNATALAGTTNSATPGATGSTSTLPPYTSVCFYIRYLQGVPVGADWAIGGLSIDGVDDPKLQFADTFGSTAEVAIATNAGDIVADSEPGDLVILSSAKVRIVPQGASASGMVIGAFGAEVPYDHNWHYVGYGAECQWNAQSNYSDQNLSSNMPFGATRFKRDESGVVYLEGLLAGLTITTLTTLFTLPPGYRPNYTLMFMVEGGSGPARIVIDSSGNVSAIGVSGAQAYLSVTGVSFMAEDYDPPKWHDATLLLAGTWVPYNTGNSAPPRYCIDSAGDLHLSGMVKSGTSISTIFTLPAGFFNTDWTDIFVGAAVAAGTAYYRIDVDTTGNVKTTTAKSGATNAGVSLDGIVLPSVGQSGAWHPGNYLNSWVAYDGVTVYGGMQNAINKNGVVSMRGLIKSGTTGNSFGPNLYGLMPEYELVYLCDANTGQARVDVYGRRLGFSAPAGTIALQSYTNSGTNGYVSLSSLRWHTTLA